jgi:hypothetical protein
MKINFLNFKGNFLLYFLFFSIIIFGSISFYRFVFLQDYIVYYEGDCDPAVNSCFVGCEDDECNTEYFYSKVERYAPRLIKECGNNIINCEYANICSLGEEGCFITFCDREVHENSCSSFSFVEDNFIIEDSIN